MTIDTSREAVDRLLDGVTPGPWAEAHRRGEDDQHRTQVFPAGDTDNTIATLHWHSVPTERGFTTDRAENARFIAAARDLVPALLAERDAALAEVARLSTPPDDAEVADLVERLKLLSHPLAPIAADALTRLSHAHAAMQAEYDVMAASMDEEERKHGLSTSGGMWRFWANMSRERAETNDALRAELAAEKDAHTAERKLADDLARAGGFARTALSGLIRPEIAINALDSVLDAHAARRKPLTKGCLHTTPCTCGYPE